MLSVWLSTKIPRFKLSSRKVLTVVMDGVGLRAEKDGNAVHHAHTPVMDLLSRQGSFCSLKAHGSYVGLSSDKDMGNSEVGHNALGAGKIYDQGAKLVDIAVESGKIFSGRVWRELVSFVSGRRGNVHLIGLLSDGNVHSHQKHLFSMLRQLKEEGQNKVFVHPLFDGRDVPAKSAEGYGILFRLIYLLELGEI